MYQQHRRYPFTDAVNHPVNHGHPPPTPPKPAIYQKQQHQANAPGSPPLPRQNAKITPPSPPRIICDKGGRYQLQRVGFLGEGGFARVYEVKDHRDVRFACKVVTKASLKTKKAKTKLYAEIKIHRSLTHPNIVNFHDCFEDQDNVYMTLELCPSGSLMDMLRRRRRFTELEARVFMVQLIGACHYMHTHQVIHRDLKLGNLFLDGRMNIKVGDFGLAALIENPGERKKTICGTPNYIAPEVLFDTVNGHSFEVDTWSVGVILYTLIVGRPPFQTKDVKAIYKRIRDNDYDFPSHAPPSSHAQNLIQQILTPDPSCRPTLHDILDHDFFVLGPVPAYIPSSAHDAPPYFGHIPKSVSDTNLRRLRRNALLDEPLTSINVPRPNAEPEPAVPSSNSAGSVSGAPGRTIASSIAQQEKDFQKAVQPGSPISALLSSARQPLLVSASSTGNLRDKLERDAKDSPLLMRKLQTVQRESPLRRVARAEAVDGAEDEESRARKKELESQKARIVAQMAPVREEDEEDEGHVAAAHALPELKREEPQPVFQGGKEKVKGWERRVHSATTQRKEKEAENMPPPATQRAGEKVVSVRSRLGPSSSTTSLPPSSTTASLQKPTPATTTAGLSSHSRKPSVNLGTSTSGSTVTLAPGQVPQLVASAGFDAFGATLAHAFTCKAAGKLFRDPQIDVINPLPEEKVFIVSWVDYCNKYGMGYALTDGTVGVYFNDSTTTVLSPDKTHLDYIATRKVASATGTVSGPVYVRKSYTVTQHPEELKTKVYLVRQFEKYIMDRLYGDYDWTFVDKERSRGMEWVVKYLRMQNIIVFRLSNDILQFNFNDHSKLILSSQGLLVTHIDKNYRLTRWPLSEVIATSLRYAEPRGTVGVSQDQIKFNQKLVDKLKYCKEILLSIKSATSGSTSAAGTEGKA
ncbi:Protein kinase-like domain containing protein [Amanita muscaria]